MKENFWLVCEAAGLLALVVLGYLIVFRGAWVTLIG
jgi:hypothetical protein